MGLGPHPGLPNQPPQTPASRAAFLQIVIYMVIAVASIIGWNLYQEHKAGKRPHWSMLWGVVVFILYGLFLLSLDYPQIPAKIVAVLGLHLTQGLAVVFVAVLGFAASKFKLHGKLYFGIVEVFFGVISSVAVVTRVNFTPVPVSQMNLAQVTALIGSVYVVARGFTNIYEAKHPSPETKVNGGPPSV